MGRTTLGLILLLCATAQAGTLLEHQRVLLRGDVPLRISSDESGVCAVEVHVDAWEPAQIEAWKAIPAKHGDTGVEVRVDRRVFALKAPQGEFAAVLKAAGAAVPDGWRAVGLVCGGSRKAWIKAADAAFGRRSRQKRAPSTSSPPPTEALQIVEGDPALTFVWQVEDLSWVEARLAAELRRSAVAAALADEEIEGAVSVAVAFDQAHPRVELGLTFPGDLKVEPFVALVKAGLAEVDAAPLDAAALDELWPAQDIALARYLDPPSRRATALATWESHGVDPERELTDAEALSARAFHDRCDELAVDRAAMHLSHPAPPHHGAFYADKKKKKSVMDELSFEEDE